MSKVAIIYDSATHNTEMMANAIAEGLKSEGLAVKLTHVHEAKIEDIKGIDRLVLGSGTYHHEIMPALEVFIDQVKDVDLKDKVGAAFCSYGCSPEVVYLIMNLLKGYDMDTMDGLLIHEKPDEAGVEKCREFGGKIAQKVKGR